MTLGVRVMVGHLGRFLHSFWEVVEITQTYSKPIRKLTNTNANLSKQPINSCHFLFLLFAFIILEKE